MIYQFRRTEVYLDKQKRAWAVKGDTDILSCSTRFELTNATNQVTDRTLKRKKKNMKGKKKICKKKSRKKR